MTAASRAFCDGSTMPLNPSWKIFIATGNAPLMGNNVPSNDSSPMMAYDDNLSVLTISDAANIPMAIGKSYAEPALRMSAGDRLIITCLRGKGYLLYAKAESMRSWLSLMALSGNPTKKKRTPEEMLTSIEISVASMPCTAAP